MARGDKFTLENYETIRDTLIDKIALLSYNDIPSVKMNKSELNPIIERHREALVKVRRRIYAILAAIEDKKNEV